MLIVLFSIAALLSVLVELVLSAIERDEDKRPAGQSREDRLLLRQIGRRNDTAGI